MRPWCGTAHCQARAVVPAARCAQPCGGRAAARSRRRRAGTHQEVARVAARKVLQRVHDRQQRQVLQRVAAQDEVLGTGTCVCT